MESSLWKHLKQHCQTVVRAMKELDPARIVVMGAAKVGKTCVIKKYLYDTFAGEHCPTIEDMYKGEYKEGNNCMNLDILDTTGSYNFPAMVELAITQGDAFVLVYSASDFHSFQDVKKLRDMIIKLKGQHVPIVVVCNKIDLEDTAESNSKEIAEAVVNLDWGHGFVEASAKENLNISCIFREILIQARKSASARLHTKVRVSICE